ERVLGAVVLHQASVDLLLPFALGVEDVLCRVLSALDHVVGVIDGVGASDESAVDTRHQRICTQPVRTVDGIVTLTASVQAFDVSALVEVNPEAAHGVVHAREDLYGDVARIVADKLLVNLEDAFELTVERGTVDVGQVEIDHRLAVNAEIVLVNHFVDSAGGDVARHQVAVLRVPLFQEVPAFAVGNTLWSAPVAGLTGNPHATAFSARRLGHQPQLVFAWNAGWMHLDEFAIGVVRTLLIQSRLCRSGADHRVGGLAEDGAVTSGRHDHRFCREGVDGHAVQIHGADSLAGALIVDDGREELPGLVLGDFALRLVAPYLLVESV